MNTETRLSQRNWDESCISKSFIYDDKVAAIKVAVGLLLRNKASFKEMRIHTDNGAAILVLSTETLRSNLVKECLFSQEIASSYFIIKLVWVPFQYWIAGNCKADELAKRAGSLLASWVLPLHQWTWPALSRRKSTTYFYATARSFWPRVEGRRSTELLPLSKVYPAVILGTLTGHCSICIHTVRLKIQSDTSCI